MDEQFASEKLRFESFSSWTRLSATTQHQLAIAGFVARENEFCSCRQCSVKIFIDDIDNNRQYSSNYFRQLHRKLSLQSNQQCPFLLCQIGTNIDDLQTSSTFDWNNAEYPEFYQLQTRLETFHSWPYLSYQNTFITPDHLAKRGFFFTNQGDAVTCFYCGNILQDWKSFLNLNNENIVQLEHARFFPCRFILSFTGNHFVKEANFFQRVTDEGQTEAKKRRLRNPIRIDEKTTKKPESIAECRATFDTWPTDAPVPSENLIQAGFFYLGESSRVQCHVCHLILDDLPFHASPITLHRQRNPQCEFLQIIDSIKFGDAQCVEEKWRLETFNANLFPIVATRETIEKLCQELAACGFFCSGRGQNIRCAYCGVPIKPNLDHSIMSQHRTLMKNSTTIECSLVRAQCLTNRPIPSRARFPETRKFETVFARRQSFETYQQRFRVSNEFIEERVYAGFFLENSKRMRCFQCGNALPIQSRRLQTDYPQYDTAKLHAYFYPTCEWVLEILGPKYVAQTIFDRKKSNRIESPFSTTSVSLLSDTSPAISITSANFFDLSDYADDSDDDHYETVARPFSARFTGILSPSLSPAPSSDQSPSVSMQPTTDSLSSQSISPIVPSDTHPFRTLALQTSPPMSPSAVLTPADPRQILSSEINRLETFRQHNRTDFARLSIEELAYAGFYLSSDGKTVKCPWCDVELTEKRFESILHRRPMLAGSPLSNDPWTAMRVHRHAVGQITDQNNAWCIWVRRQQGTIYPNQMNPQSVMAYPEFPLYESVEKRIRSFQPCWPFLDGSLLSKQLTAEAGFIHLGEDQVICFYCGNALREFQPRDSPFEEHALANPLCDFIVKKLGENVIKDIVGEGDSMPQAKQRIEIRGNEIIKTILYTPSRLTQKKLNRKRVQRMISAPDKGSPSIVSSSTTESRSISINEELFDELCQLCCDQTGSHVYHPCQHYPMCSNCVARLTDSERKQCIVCHRDSTISLK